MSPAALRRQRSVLLAALVLVLGLAACAAAEGGAVGARLRAIEPATTAEGGRIGRLKLIAAYELTHRSATLGGLSGIEIDGDDLLLLSDRSHLFRARRIEDAAGRLLDLTGWTELPLPKGLRRADTEALALLPDGTLAIGAEDRAALYLLAHGASVPRLLPLPAYLRAGPPNEGIEALTALPDGSLLAIAEGAGPADDLHWAAILTEKGSRKLTLRAPGGFRPTGAALAGSMLFLLERRLTLLSGLEARIVAVPAAAVQAQPTETNGGSVPIEGEELAQLDAASFGENFEGIAARDLGRGRYRLYLVSDDDFSPLLRSLILQLEWQAPAVPAAG